MVQLHRLGSDLIVIRQWQQQKKPVGVWEGTDSSGQNEYSRLNTNSLRTYKAWYYFFLFFFQPTPRSRCCSRGQHSHFVYENNMQNVMYSFFNILAALLNRKTPTHNDSSRQATKIISHWSSRLQRPSKPGGRSQEWRGVSWLDESCPVSSHFRRGFPGSTKVADWDD